MKYLITGSAGFIGFHVARRLLAEGHGVVGIDAMTPYYDVRLKERRNAQLLEKAGFSAHVFMLEDDERLSVLVRAERPDVVIHLAAQAGVRYSVENPRAYLEANIVGTFNLLEACRSVRTPHLMIASTSSVYGANQDFPFVETDRADHQLTFYAATKKATEVMSHSYAHLFSIPTTCFRFFTVYGPWGRPDMALFKFTEGISNGTPIDLYNGGDVERDFTFIDDLVVSIARLSSKIPEAPSAAAAGDDPLLSSPVAPYRIVNIGNGRSVNLRAFIDEIEKCLGRKGTYNLLPMQAGDVPRTWADTTFLRQLIGFTPDTPLSVGIPAFVKWYREYRGI